MSARKCGPCPCQCHKTYRVTIRQITRGRPGWAHGEFVPALLPASTPQDPARCVHSFDVQRLSAPGGGDTPCGGCGRTWDQLDQAGLLRQRRLP